MVARFCPTCDTRLRQRASFCFTCGARVEPAPADDEAELEVQTEAVSLPLGNRGWQVLLIGVAVFGMLMAFTGNGRSSHSSPEGQEVTYYVSGSLQRVDLTVLNGSGTTELMDGVETPWQQSFPVRQGQSVYVSAQSPTGGGSLDCAIILDKTVISAAHSTRRSGFVECSASVPSPRP